MIDLYFWLIPNGHEVTIFLEEPMFDPFYVKLISTAPHYDDLNRYTIGN